MLRVDNRVVASPIIDILKELRRQIKLQGSQYLYRDINQSGDNVQICCPFHKGGLEKRASMGVLVKDKDGVRAGTAHCFSCGEKSDIFIIINKCFGHPFFSAFAKRWILENFAAVDIINRELNIDINRTTKSKEIKYVSEEELNSYRYYHPYMFKRKLTEAVIEKFDVGYDEKTKCLTFPVRDITGKTLFIARRSVEKKYFNYPKDVEKPVYGIYEIGQNRYTTIIICESIINALTCWGYGMPAVALNGAYFSEYQLKQLKELKCRKFILGFDPDDAGNNAADKLEKLIGGQKIINKFLLPAGKDINDLSKEEFKKLEIIW